MRLTVMHRDLTLLCKLLATVAPSRSAATPILETVRIESTGTHLHMDALRLVDEAPVRVRVTLPLSADPGVAAVPLRDLRDAIKGGGRHSYDDVILQVHAGTERLEVAGQRVKGGQVRLADPADWPDPTGGDWQPWATVAGSVVPWLGGVAIAASQGANEWEPPRIALRGVQLSTNPTRGTLTAAATDSYRLHTLTKPAKEVAAAAATRLVPAEAVMALAQMADLLRDALYHVAELPLTLEQTDTAVRVVFGPITLTTTTIDAAFPDWPRLVATPGTREGELAITITNPPGLVSLLDNLPKVILDANAPLKITFAGGGATAQASVTEHGGGKGWTVNATATLPMAPPDTATGMAAYTPLFLRDLVAAGAAAWQPNGLTFHVIPDGCKPALLTERDGTAGDGFTGVLLPVRLPEQEATDEQA